MSQIQITYWPPDPLTKAEMRKVVRAVVRKQFRCGITELRRRKFRNSGRQADADRLLFAWTWAGWS